MVRSRYWLLVTPTPVLASDIGQRLHTVFPIATTDFFFRCLLAIADNWITITLCILFIFLLVRLNRSQKKRHRHNLRDTKERSEK